MTKVIYDNPFDRYEVQKTIFKSWCRKKSLVVRTETHTTYIMVSAPMVDKQGKPNTVMAAVNKLLTLSHPKITAVMEAYEWEGNVHWIMEDWHSKRDTRGLGINLLTEHQIAETVQALCSAITYLHSHKIIHGCLAMDDIGFYLDDDYQLNFRITDFGIGHQVDAKECSRVMDAKARKATPPEARKKAEFTKAGDVFSIGVVAYYLLTNDINPEPVMERMGFDLAEALSSNTKKLSQEAQNFVLACVKLTPADRIDASELLEHPWFQTIEKTEGKSVCLLDKIASEMSSFMNQGRFRIIASRTLATHQLRHHTMDEYRILFDWIDKDSNGSLSYHEFYQALRGRLPASDNFDFTVMVDVDENNVIDFDEFLGLTLAFKEDLELTTVVEAFHSLDIDCDGQITASDLSMKTNLSEEECLEIIAEALARDTTKPELLNIDMPTFVKMFYELSWKEWMKLKVGMKKDIIEMNKNKSTIKRSNTGTASRAGFA